VLVALLVPFFGTFCAKSLRIVVKQDLAKNSPKGGEKVATNTPETQARPIAWFE
jgi:hypothetical protein